MNKRVVITGLGAVTPIGNTVEEFWNNAKKGVIGFDNIKKFDTDKFRVKLAAEVKDFDPTQFMDRKEARRMDGFSQYAIAATKEAIEDSGLSVTPENAERIGVIIGSGIGSIGSIENENKKMLEKGPSRVSPMLIPMTIVNMASGNVAIHFGLKGKCLSVVTACATGTNSIGEAFRSVKYGETDAILAGGCESGITPLGIAGFQSLTALSESHDKYRASIPFDKERNGFVMGEGAGVIVVEELEHAKARGAKILAEIIGYGSTCDAYHMTSPIEDGSGAAAAMKQAMKEGGVNPEVIEYINAHGTSTHHNDLFETMAIKSAFGKSAEKVAISSTKSMVGHMLGAAGAVELIACVKSIQESYVHPTVGYKEADPECDLDYVPNEGRSMEINYAISNSLGFGGHNASLLIKKYVD